MVAIMNLADAKNKDGSWGPDFQIRCKNFGFSPRKCFCTGAYNNILGAACCKTCARGQVCKHNHHQNKNISGVQLGKRTFAGCSGIRSLRLPAGLESIPHCAFYKCTGIAALRLPETVKSVGESVVEDGISPTRAQHLP